MEVVKYNNPYPKRPKSPQDETAAFWYICGLILLILIINNLSHLYRGEGIF